MREITSLCRRADRKDQRVTMDQAEHVEHVALTRTRRGQLWSRGVGGESGATLVEFAIVVPLLFGLLFGVIDFGITLSNLHSLRQGSREVARRAVVADVGTYTTCPIAGGDGLSADTKSLICMAKDKVGLDEAKTMVSVGFDASYTEGEALIICTQYPTESTSGFYGFMLNGRHLTTEVDMRVEKTGASIQSFAEPGDWSWCG